MVHLITCRVFLESARPFPNKEGWLLRWFWVRILVFTEYYLLWSWVDSLPWCNPRRCTALRSANKHRWSLNYTHTLIGLRCEWQTCNLYLNSLTPRAPNGLHIYTHDIMSQCGIDWKEIHWLDVNNNYLWSFLPFAVKITVRAVVYKLHNISHRTLVWSICGVCVWSVCGWWLVYSTCSPG